ncbi:hypothetical protein J4Q44_G00386130 [Coregonus suidteri]|uniref:Potassium channel domain-containing protein n=1 Tax=Coregonus suidteri TaxID=861788 RepID=A0AAN8Q452_9TELE
MEMQDMGGASGSYQVKSRSTRRWRTSCKPVVPIQGRTLRSREDAGEHTLEGSQESRAKGEFPTTGQNTQSGKQNRGSTRSPKCSHAQTKTCTQCHRQRGGQGRSGGQREAASVYEQDQPSCGMEGIKEEEEEKVQDGTGLTWSKPCDSCQPPDHADPENCSSDVGDWGKPDSPHAQEGLHPETSLNKEHFQDKLWDKDIHTGGKDVASGIMRCVEDFDGMVGAVIGFVDHIKSAERDSERLGGTRGIAEGELPNRWIDVQSSERHCCSERGCLKACSTQPPSPAGGSISTATDETGYGQTNQETKSDSQYNKLCEKCLPEEKDPAAVDKEGLQKPVHGLCEKEGEEGIQSTEPENRELCGEHGEKLPEVRSTDDEARLVGGDITSQRTERGLHWATEEHESEEMEERCFSDLPATLTEEAVGGWREAGTGQWNSLLRGSADAGPATSVTHSPPNPASSGAMATGLPAPNAGQTDAGGGALVPLLLSPEEQEWKRGLDENKVAANGGFLDGGPEAEGEDDFGLFMQAEEQPLWDDSFTASPLVPSGKSESVALENHSIANESIHWTSGWTDSSFQQSEDAWTAFPKDTAGEGEDKREQWWPTNAVEETRGRFSAKQNVNNVFVEAFPSLSTPPYDRDAVPTLSQLLRGILDHESSAEDHGLLDGFHDLNKMFGLKYKKANAVSRERLLRSLRLGQCNTENMTGERAANYSPSLGLPSSSQHAQALTTVGYGHTTPLSDTGKAFSIFYALLGVPFTMLVLTACVQRLMHLVTYGPIGMCRQRIGLDPLAATAIHFAILLLLVVLGFFVVPAVVFSHIEDTWSFLDAIYFCFITLCTIGLGDYVPGEKPGQKFRSLYKISVMVYLFVGLMMMYLVLRAFHRMADLHGLTSFFQLPHCDEDIEEDKEPIIEAGPEDQHEAEASAKPLDPASQTSYNTINR